MIRYIRDWQHRRELNRATARLAVATANQHSAGHPSLNVREARAAFEAAVERGRAQSAEEDR